MSDEPISHCGAAGTGPGTGGADRAAAPRPGPAVRAPDADPDALLALALSVGGLGLWGWDSGSDAVSWTRPLESMHGLPARESAAPFETFERSILPDDRARVRATLDDVLRSGRETFELEYRVALPDGGVRWIEARGRLFADTRGGPGRIVAACADATARRRAQERERLLVAENDRLREHARHADQAKSDFLAVMSHELRTPLNAIMGYTELWLMGVPATVPAPVRAQIERVRWCAQHLLRLIEEILTFTRLEAGREEARLERTDVAALARDAASAARPLASERGLDLVLTLPPDAVHVKTDAPKVKQILFNLLDNAVKFTDRGDVRLRLERGDDAILFHVQDAGIGIATEHIERIFEPFWQVESARTRSREGTGLGLSVARRLARLLDGDVTVTSVPGAGSTFRLRLPEAAPAGGGSVSDVSDLPA